MILHLTAPAVGSFQALIDCKILTRDLAMRLLSVETTPNPNSMKLNVDQQLGAPITYTRDQADGCPAFVRRLLDIAGVQSVFACGNFVTVNKDPRLNWSAILDKATAVFNSDSEAAEPTKAKAQDSSAAGTDGQVQVFVQTFRGIPIQVKVVDRDGETRLSLGERFNDTALLIQEKTGADYLAERYWADKGHRYGTRDEVAQQVVAEIIGTLDKPPAPTKETLLDWLKESDWHTRFLAVQELSSSDDHIPVLAAALKDEHPQVRRLAAAALGSFGNSDAVEPLCQAMLEDVSVGVRRTAGDALSDIGDVAAQPAICKALADPNKLVRWRAARFLSDVGTEDAIPFLQKAADDPEFEVRLEVRAAIDRITGGAQGLGPAWKRIVES